MPIGRVFRDGVIKRKVYAPFSLWRWSTGVYTLTVVTKRARYLEGSVRVKEGSVGVVAFVTISRALSAACQPAVCLRLEEPNVLDLIHLDESLGRINLQFNEIESETYHLERRLLQIDIFVLHFSVFPTK